MKKVILDLSYTETKDEVHDLLKREMAFPDYYGKNLDALYDCLTDLSEDTAVGFYMTEDDSVISEYLRKVQQVFADAEEENDHLAVFFLTNFSDEE